jgi:hypothetical protein
MSLSIRFVIFLIEGRVFEVRMVQETVEVGCQRCRLLTAADAG